MGHIKEPKGVDFIIKSEPLTNDERMAISEFIRQYKSKQPKKVKKGRLNSSQSKIRATNKTLL
jgi:hypothetical protein